MNSIDLALALYNCGAFKDKTHPDAVDRASTGRGFKLKLHEDYPEAPLSPFYISLRTADNLDKPGPLTPELVRHCATFMANLVRDRGVQFDCLVGLPNAGVPFANAFPRNQTVTQLCLRKEIVNGKRRIVGPPNGDFNPGQRVLVIDDLITAAQTKFESIAVLQAAGLVVTDIVVLIDRQPLGKQHLGQAGYNLHALWTIAELLTIFTSAQCITKDLQIEILDYLRLGLSTQA